MKGYLSRFRDWMLSVEITKPSIIHWTLYVWLLIGVGGVEYLRRFHSGYGHPEDIDDLLGNFWWLGWYVTVIGCVALFFLSQVMFFYSMGRKRVKYAGLVFLAAADIGEFCGVAGFFIAMYAQADMSASMNWFRMAMAGFIVSCLAIFCVRDIHRLAIIELIRIRGYGRRME